MMHCSGLMHWCVCRGNKRVASVFTFLIYSDDQLTYAYIFLFLDIVLIDLHAVVQVLSDGFHLWLYVWPAGFIQDLFGIS